MVKIRIRNKRKMMNAGRKNTGLATNSFGRSSKVGMVPVRKPMGQISVNINPIRNVVRNTRPIKITYFRYRSVASRGCFPILLITGMFFIFLATGAVARCSNPIGHAHPQIALPVRMPKKPMIRRGNNTSFHRKLY